MMQDIVQVRRAAFFSKRKYSIIYKDNKKKKGTAGVMVIRNICRLEDIEEQCAVTHRR
jgi:hypothetical protein